MSSCRTGTKAKDDPFLYRNHYPLAIRVMIGLFGLVLWLLPYQLLIAPNWNHFSWILLPFGLIGLMGAVGGASFLLSALLGEARETRLDFACQQVVQTARDWLFRPTETRTPFSDIAILDLRKPSWATDEDVFAIHPVLQDGNSLPAFGAFPSREEAGKIIALMGHLPDGMEDLSGNWSNSELAALRKSITARMDEKSQASCAQRSVTSLH